MSLALARLRQSAAVGGALSSTIVLALPAVGACIDQPADATAVNESSEWAQYEGIRDTRMVAFTGEWWTECSNNNTRFGCGATAIHVKVRVQPVLHADLAWKRVGVVFHTPEDPREQTAIGSYYTTYADGTEEWQVTMVVPQWQTAVLFDAWYQDGRQHTWIDDNQGELHAINAGPAYQIVRVEPWLNTVTVGDSGVQGRISVQLADLDFDKQVELVASKDGWQTVLHLPLSWVEDLSAARERWQIDLDLPGAADHFEYAVVYRHGVVNQAKTYEFWDNNGSANWRVDRAPTPVTN